MSSVDDILNSSMLLIGKEIDRLKERSERGMLDPVNAKNLTEYVRSLTYIVHSKRRLKDTAEAETMKTEDIEQALLEEAKRIKAKHADSK